MFKHAHKTEDVMYAIFRVLVGFMFAMHGAQKIFGWFSKNGAQPLISMMGIVGVLELLAGLFIMLGLWTRLSTIFGGVIMIGAYFGVHFISFLFGGLTINNPLPIANGGELALMYLIAFLMIFAKGNGIFSLEKVLCKKERF